ncbi:gamete and mating-type specific protein A-like, partial [Drosophila grimshawi]
MSALSAFMIASLTIAVAVAQYYGDSFDSYDYNYGQYDSGNAQGTQTKYVYSDAGTIYSNSGNSDTRSYAYASAGGPNGAKAVAEAPGSNAKPYRTYRPGYTYALPPTDAPVTTAPTTPVPTTPAPTTPPPTTPAPTTPAPTT